MRNDCVPPPTEDFGDRAFFIPPPAKFFLKVYDHTISYPQVGHSRIV